MNRTFKISLLLLIASVAPAKASVVTTDLLYFWDASDDATATGSGWQSKQGSGNATNDTWTPQTDVSRVGVSSSTTITDAYDFTGFVGSAGTLDGTATREDFQAGMSGITGNTASFEFWIKPDGLSNGQQMIFETGGATRGFGLSLWDDELRFAIKHNSGQSASDPPTEIVAHTLTSGDIADFIQVVLTIDDTAKEIELFVNPLGAANPDSPVDTDTWPGDNPFGTSGASLGGINADGNGEIGGGDDTPADTWGRNSFVGFEGQIGIVLVYDDVLEGTEVEQNFEAVTIPEPSTFAIALLALVGFCFAACRTRVLG